MAKDVSFNTKAPNKLDYVADLESAIKSTGHPDETKEHISQRIATNLRNRRPVKLDDTDEQKAIKDLKVDKDIIILPADKERTTAVMNKFDYNNKASTLLKDTEAYQPLDIDQGKMMVNSISQKLKLFKDKEKLNERSYNRIRPNDASRKCTIDGLPTSQKVIFDGICLLEAFNINRWICLCLVKQI